MGCPGKLAGGSPAGEAIDGFTGQIGFAGDVDGGIEPAEFLPAPKGDWRPAYASPKSGERD